MAHLIQDPYFRCEIDRDASSPAPQVSIWRGQHQCVIEGFSDDEESPSSSRAGEVIIKHQLQGDRGHYSVLRMAYLKLDFAGFPHNVVAQITRHQDSAFLVQCLASDTQITFVNAKGRAPSRLSKTIGELYELWTNGEKATRLAVGSKRRELEPRTYRRSAKNRIKKMRVRVLDESTGSFSFNHIKDVIFQGVQPVYRVKLENGKSLDCTVNHKILTSEGWQRMGEAVGLLTAEDNSVLDLTRESYFMCNGVNSGNFKPGQKPWNYNPDALYRSKDWLEACLAEDLSPKEIAQKAGCSVECIKKWVYHYGLSLNIQPKNFKPGMTPWNKGVTGYQLTLSSEEIERRVQWGKENKSGEKSNWWKGGTTSQRLAIANWTTSVARRVHRRFDYTCQRCFEVGKPLDCHHIVPVWADESRAYEIDNLITLCRTCHRDIHCTNSEFQFASHVGAIPQDDFWADFPPSNKLIPHPVKVVSVEFLGNQPTYDLEMEDPHHNFVANGVIVHNSNRYTGDRFLKVASGELKPEEVFYWRPVGKHSSRNGFYERTEEMNLKRRNHCLECCQMYAEEIAAGVSYEDARGLIPYDFRQNFTMAGDLQAVFHWIDQRSKADSQLEVQTLTGMAFEKIKQWVPELANWYEQNRYGKARLAP